MLRRANAATKAMVKDQTTYPKVDGNVGLTQVSGISIRAPHTPHKIGTIVAKRSQRGIFISLLSRCSFQTRVRRDDPSLVFDDVLAKAKRIAVLIASSCQEFCRDLYGDDVNQELPFPSNRGNLQYQIAGIGREVLTNQKYLHAEPSQIFGQSQVLSAQSFPVNPQGNP